MKAYSCFCISSTAVITNFTLIKLLSSSGACGRDSSHLLGHTGLQHHPGTLETCVTQLCPPGKRWKMVMHFSRLPDALPHRNIFAFYYTEKRDASIGSVCAIAAS